MGFRIEGYTQTKEVMGGNKLVNVREYQVVALPSETYFQFRRHPPQPGYNDPKPAAQQLSDRIEAVLADPRIVDVVYLQDTTAGGRLIDKMRTFYSTEDGAISGSVEQDLAHFGPGNTLGLVADEIAAGGDKIGS